MSTFAIIEIVDGYEVVEVLPGQTAEDAALATGGVLIDPGPYHSFDDANDALNQLEILDERDNS